MSDSSVESVGASDSGRDHGVESPPGMPRWVKVSALVVGLVLLVFVILKVAGVGGRHGPGMHQAAAPADVPDARGIIVLVV